jgi:hypothetical protein
MRAERLELSTQGLKDFGLAMNSQGETGDGHAMRIAGQSSYLLDLARELQAVSQAIVRCELTEFSRVKELLLSHIGQAQASMSSQSRSQ